MLSPQSRCRLAGCHGLVHDPRVKKRSASTSSRKLVATAAVGALALGLWSLSGEEHSEVAAADALPNQIWIDRVPQTDRDMITHLLLLDHPRARNFGLVGNSSQWRHHIEVLRWQLNGNHLGLLFPQDRRKAKLGVRTWECEGEAPAPFELCLELVAGKRSLKMYSRHDWVVEPQGERDLSALAAEYPELAGLAGTDAPGAPDEDEDEGQVNFEDSEFDALEAWLPMVVAAD